MFVLNLIFICLISISSIITQEQDPRQDNEDYCKCRTVQARMFNSTVQGRVFNSTVTVDYGDFYFLASIFITDGFSLFKHLCTATIINYKVVLTTARCVSSFNLLKMRSKIIVIGSM